MTDNALDMSGFGIGITVGLGIIIGAILGLPDPPANELIIGFIVYSILSGAAYESIKYIYTELRRDLTRH